LHFVLLPFSFGLGSGVDEIFDDYSRKPSTPRFNPVNTFIVWNASGTDEAAKAAPHKAQFIKPMYARLVQKLPWEPGLEVDQACCARSTSCDVACRSQALPFTTARTSTFPFNTALA